MTRPRNKGYRDLPPNLYYHKRFNKFVYRHPATRRMFYIDPSKDDPIQIAIQANMQLMKQPSKVRKILNLTIGISTWCDAYFNEVLPERELSPKTLADYRHKIGVIKKHFVDREIELITTLNITDFLKQFPAIQSNRYRSLLVDLFNAAESKGYRDGNPAEKSATRKEKRKRDRLDIADFWDIYNHPENPKALKSAMLLFLITTQRPVDLCGVLKTNVYDGHVHIIQSKTKKRIAIKITPWLQEILDECFNDGIDSPYIIHRISENPAMAKRNAHPTMCTVNWLSKEFSYIRNKLPKFRGMAASKRPPFYEIRSLAKTAYEKSGYNSKNLAGHSKKMHDHYLEGHDIWNVVEIDVNIARTT